MVTVVPPATGPEVGDTDVTTGAGGGGGGVYVNVLRMTISVEVCPTASHELAETHDTLLSWTTFEGMVWLVHVVPLNESAAPPEEEELEPTASQKVVAETHDTPSRLLTPEKVCGLDHVVTFHESATPS